MEIKPNIRIQLFNEEGLFSDRLVSQLPEFYAGPKEVHKGPIRIEFTLVSKDDATAAIDYLRALIGDLPLKVKGTTSTVGRKPNTTSNDDVFDNNKEQIIKDLLELHKDNQDTLITELRKSGFIFVHSSFLKFVIPDTYKLKEMHTEKYEWLVRRTKEAKDPRNDKYDPQILIGISIMSERNDRVVLYTYGEYVSRYKIPVPAKKAIKLSKTNLIKFPHYMNEEERLKYGVEHRALFNTPDKKPSKFYMRWFKDVVVGDELKISEEDIQKRLSDDN